ncbi:hypothetical protein N7501_001025 [Penicillium viridicatum]|nr:hypothetical protein N7501_001025 [Penicillium viridicatum]
MFPPPSLQGKVFALTGAASGIGRATALLLARHGALLSLADVDKATLAKTHDDVLQEYCNVNHVNSESIPSSPIFTRTVDVRSQKECSSWIEATVAHFGQSLAGAANLAGVFGPNIGRETGAVRNLDDTEFDWVMDVNVKGTLNCLRAELAHMQTADGAGRPGGSIVNAASVAGIVGGAHNGPYVASKHAVIGLTRTAVKEEGSRGIRLNAIAPGIIATPMIQQIEHAVGRTELFGEGDPGALGRKGEASEVAEVIVFLLSPQSSFVNGTVIPVDGGWMC